MIPLQQAAKINWQSEVGMAWSENSGAETEELFSGYEDAGSSQNQKKNYHMPFGSTNS